MTELIDEHAGVDVDLDTDPSRSCGASPTSYDIPVEAGWGPGKLLLEIYEKTTEAELWGPMFVLDYPAEVSPLARAHRDEPGLRRALRGDRRRPRARATRSAS